MITTVLFDLDGTLLDTAPDFAYTINTLRTNKGLNPLELSVIRTATAQGIEALLHAGFGVSKTDPHYEALKKESLDLYQEILAQYTKPFPGVLDLLGSLEQKQVPWGIVTNRLSLFTHPLLEKLDLSKRAACIVSGDTTPNPKPHPAPLLHACQTLSVSPQECIYIGDTEVDIEAGKAAGMTTLAVLFGYTHDKAEVFTWEADHCVHHANEILPWLEQKWQR